MKRIFLGLMSLLFLTFAACGAKEIPQNTGPYRRYGRIRPFLIGNSSSNSYRNYYVIMRLVTD